MLGGLFRLFGAEAAQRICGLAGGADLRLGRVCVRRGGFGPPPWHLLPCIAMLAYGWVFHMGFFNFYLSLGLCFWALALVVATEFPSYSRGCSDPRCWLIWRMRCRWPGWLGLVAYMMVAGRLSARSRAYLTGGSMLAMVILHAVIAGKMVSNWSANQITLTTGLDQTWVFDAKYYAVMIALLFIWAVLFLNLIHLSDARQVVSSMPFQFCLLSAAAVFILPTSILFPGFHHALVYIAERMSLAVGICFCALLAAARPRALRTGSDGGGGGRSFSPSCTAMSAR